MDKVSPESHRNRWSRQVAPALTRDPNNPLERLLARFGATLAAMMNSAQLAALVEGEAEATVRHDKPAAEGGAAPCGPSEDCGTGGTTLGTPVGTNEAVTARN